MRIEEDKDEIHKSLRFYIRKAALHELSIDDDGHRATSKLSVKLREFLKTSGTSKVLDESRLLQQFHSQGHAHGKQSVSHYHLSRMCDFLITPIIERIDFRGYVLRERSTRTTSREI